MSWTISRRDYLRGSAALAGAAFMPGRSLAAEPLAYKGELALVGLIRTPPDEALTSLIGSFESAHPDIKVKVTLLPSEKFVALFTASQAAGEPVDLLLLNGQDLRRYAVSGTLMQLDEVVTDPQRFAPAALETGRVDGRLWGLPYGWYGGFPIFFNRALLDQHKLTPPTTYADFLPIRDALKAAGVKTFTHPGKNIYLWPVWFFTTFAQASGNKSIPRTVEILTGKGKFTDGDVVKGLDLVFQFGKDELLPRSVFGLEMANAMAEFSAGRASFFLNHDGMIDGIFASKPPGVELDVMLMPKLVDADVKSQFPGGPAGILAVPASTSGERKAAALALMQLLTSDASNETIVHDNNGTVPVNVAVKGSDVPQIKKLIDLSDNLVTYLDWNWPPEITRVFQEGIQAGVAGQQTATEVAEQAQSTLERLVSEGYVFDKQS